MYQAGLSTGNQEISGKYMMHIAPTGMLQLFGHIVSLAPLAFPVLIFISRQRFAHMASVRVAACLFCLTLWLPPITAAQQPPRWPEDGKWDIGVWGSGAVGYEHIHSFWDGQVWSAGISVARVITGEIGPSWFRGNLEYGWNFVPVWVTSKPQNVFGAGFDPIVLHYNFEQHRKVASYLEYIGGGLFTTSDFPPGKTSTFNFSFKAGPGVRISTGHLRSVDISLQFCHYSNATLGTRNPSLNGMQLVLGYHYHWFK